MWHGFDGPHGPQDDSGDERGGRRGPRGRRGPGRPGGWQNVDLPPADDAEALVRGTAARRVVHRRRGARRPRGDHGRRHARRRDPAADRAAAEGRISRFRAETRATRIQIAEEAEARYGRKVSWGARLGEVETLFTHLSVPVMTRLRQPERQVLDTLVDAGVARSRSEALAWAVKLVGQHAESWLAELRGRHAEVDKLRAQGPQL